VVVLNTIALAMDRYGISDQTLTALSRANIVFSTVFGVEMLIKIAGAWPLKIIMLSLPTSCLTRYI
jgi:hypothetical protein